MSEKIIVHGKNGNDLYPIFIEPDYSKLSKVIKSFGLSDRKICIVSDTNVAPLYMDTVISSFAKDMHLDSAAAIEAGRIIQYVFPAGEVSKNLTVVQDLYETLILAHFDRNDILVALGGGVVGDLTGFAAATYLRGIRFIQLPTTLLSQVDSSVGGKTGVDFKQYKNMVGAFYMPIFVFMNSGALNTLPERDYLSGMAEVIKYGLILDKKFYNYIKSHKDQILNKDAEVMEYIAYKSSDMKRIVVEEDPTEKGIRALLNMGHTIGHAVEKLMNFELMHGECVAIGSVAAAYISLKRRFITKADFDDIALTFMDMELPVTIPEKLSADDILEATKSDKKMDTGHIRFILIKYIGCAFIEHDVADTEIIEAITNCYEHE